ncbi:AsmA-like C-terminal region-containing protein [Inquilinus sp. CAU 1745]|uniref:YhdP family protein n=1 Tax=Inquilinus sp. CAU 1745 TaxID=3140369 RepID=UPI00325BD5B8
MIRGVARFTLEIAGVLMAGFVILAVILAWRLSQGPVEVDFLTPYLEDFLDDGAVEVTVGGTSLRWDGVESPVRLVASDVTLYGDDGQPIARVPEISVAVSAHSLLRRQVVLRSLTVVEPTLRAERAEDGSFRLGLDDLDDASGSGAREVVADVIAALRGDPGYEDHPLAGLRRVRVEDATIVLDDRMLDVEWTAPRADLELERVPGGLRGVGIVEVIVDDRIAAFGVDATHDFSDGSSQVRLLVHDLVPADLADLDPVLAPLAALATPVQGTVTVGLDSRLAPTGTRFALQAGAGQLRMEDFFPQPLGFAGLSMEGWIDLRGGTLAVDQFAVDLGGPRIEGAMTVVDRAGVVHLFAEADLRDLPTDLLATYWPPELERGARDWVVKHLSRGIVRQATLSVHAVADQDELTQPAIESLYGAIAFDGVTVDYLDGMPPVVDVAGRAIFDPHAFHIDAWQGRLDDLSVVSGDIEILGLEGSDETIDIEVVAGGPVATVLRVLDSPRLGYASKLGIDPATAGGVMSARLRLAFPLEKDLLMEQVAVAAAANLRDVRVPGIAVGLDAESVDGRLTLDGQGMDIDGEGLLNGVPIAFDWRENFGGGDFLTRVDVQATLDSAGLAALGIPEPDGFQGAMPVDAVYTDVDRVTATLSAEADLAGVGFGIDAFDWSKPADAPGSASVTLALHEGALDRLPAFALDAAGLTVRGEATFGPERELQEVVLGEVVYGLNRFSARAMAQADGGYAVEIRGPAIDVSPFFDGMLSDAPAPEEEVEEETEDGPPLQITLAVGEVIVAEGRSLYQATGALVRSPDGGDGWDLIDLAAATDTGGALRVFYGDDGGGLRLNVEAEDAGAALRTFGLAETVFGGRLRIVGRATGMDATGEVEAFAGDVLMEDFRVVRAPGLAQLLSALSLPGLGNLLTTDGIVFDRLVGQYRLANGLLSLSDVRTSGGAMGLTLAGNVDLNTDTVDVEGTIVPLYGVNQLIGAIPILGDILTGGEGQGVFAFTYGVEGPLAQPTVTVNPLAVLAPGFLRNLFFLEGDGSTAPPPE